MPVDYQISQKILLLDDQVEITELLERQIGPLFDCVFVNDPTEALAILLAEGPFAVVVSDYQMPAMNGVEFLEEVCSRSPDTTPIMLTAFDDIDIAINALHQGHIFRFLRKPWEKNVVIKAVSDALDIYRVKVSEKLLRRELEQTNEELQEKVKQLLEMNNLIQHWVEFSPAALYSFGLNDQKLATSYVSKNFETICGYDRTELLAEPNFLFNLIHPDDHDAIITALDDAIKTETDPGVHTYRIKHQDQGYIRIQDSARIVYNPVSQQNELVGAWLRLDNNTQ